MSSEGIAVWKNCLAICVSILMLSLFVACSQEHAGEHVTTYGDIRDSFVTDYVFSPEEQEALSEYGIDPDFMENYHSWDEDDVKRFEEALVRAVADSLDGEWKPVSTSRSAGGQEVHTYQSGILRIEHTVERLGYVEDDEEPMYPVADEDE